MKHTIFRHFRLAGTLATLRTSGPEGTVEIDLAEVKSAKFPFPQATIKTAKTVYRLNLTNFELSEYKEMQQAIEAAIRLHKRR